VLGHPIAHSLSPTIHQAAYRALGLTGWTYEAIDLDADGLAGFLASASDWAGFSLTMPLKQVALRLASQVSDLARLTGSANTLTPLPAGGWYADNTDIAGMMAALAEAWATDRGARGIAGGRVSQRGGGAGDVVALASAPASAPLTGTVLGSGATAASAVAALARIGMGSIDILARRPERAENLPGVAQALGASATVHLLSYAPPPGNVTIAALPAGAADAWAKTLPANLAGRVLLDVAYDPWPSLLARAWVAAGGTVVPGLAMLLWQAGGQVEAMTGKVAPMRAMRGALEAVRPGGTGIVHGNLGGGPWAQ
jgi:shikimate dehydrogenase